MSFLKGMIDAFRAKFAQAAPKASSDEIRHCGAMTCHDSALTSKQLEEATQGTLALFMFSLPP